MSPMGKSKKKSKKSKKKSKKKGKAEPVTVVAVVAVKNDRPNSPKKSAIVSLNSELLLPDRESEWQAEEATAAKFGEASPMVPPAPLPY